MHGVPPSRKKVRETSKNHDSRKPSPEIGPSLA